MNADRTTSPDGLMPLVSDLLGFVQQKLEMRGSLPVSRTLNMIQQLCDYRKAALYAAESVFSEPVWVNARKKIIKYISNNFPTTVKEDLE